MSGLRGFLLLFLASLWMMAGCGDTESEPTTDEASTTIPWRVDGTLNFNRDGETLGAIDIEIADTDSSRTRGMMQREAIPDDWGMLFVFPNEEERGFWMANTPMALDLMFINADSTIINIARYVQPMSAETVPSGGPARFVLEVEAGYTDSIGIVEGDRVTWSATD